MKQIITLLARFPQFPARKVRRLAKQIDLLDGFAAPEINGIIDDLVEFNMLQAERQERGDVAEMSGEPIQLEIRPVVPMEEVTERVVPLDQVLEMLRTIGTMVIEEPSDVDSFITQMNAASYICTTKKHPQGDQE
jgi:hypothetical protein